MMVSLGRTRRFLALIAAIGITSVPCVVRAQEVAVPTAAQTNASTTNHVLTRTVTLHLSRVPLRNALQAIASAAQIPLSYSPRHVPGDRLVSLDAANISAADAFAIVLKGTDVEAVALADGRVALRPVEGSVVENALPGQQGTATLSGSVVDSGTGAAIPQVTIHIDGTSLSVKSGFDGQYKLPNIAAGEYRVTARRVGYLAKTRTITVADGDNKKLDFGLNPPATQLNEVVTTALGEQRRYEVGNVISTINVDSVAPEAPITSVTDLLAARVPGLDVVQQSGVAGAGAAIRIRGQSSLLLQTDPIIIVDGIRVDNTPGGNNQLDIGGPSPSRINDWDLSEIESISVLKGPTATTEYGTDAANGVIVITTKHGRAGTPQWSVSATEEASTVPTNYANEYWDWGHYADGTGTPLWTVQNGGNPCNLAAYDNYSYPGSGLLSGTCVIDSITAFNPLDHSATTGYGTGPISSYHLNVGGGTEQVRYFIGGDLQNEEGVMHLPDVFRSEVVALGYSNSALDPNSQNQRGLTASGNIILNATTTVSVSGGYNTTYMETPEGGEAFYPGGLLLGPTLDDSAFSYGYGAPNYGAVSGTNPLAVMGNIASQETEAWHGAGTVDWRPVPWLAAHATAGIQHEAQADQNIVVPQATLVNSNFTDSAGGVIQKNQISNDTYTVDLAASATAVVFRVLHLTTTMGAQYVQNTAQGVTASATNLTGSAFTLNDGVGGNVRVAQSGSSTATEGVYVEEQLGYGERCYMPLALRIDAGNEFGSAVGFQGYPKWGLTCLVLTGQTTLRLRGSYGAAGRQPPAGSAVTTFSTNSYQAGNGFPVTGYMYEDPGNANVRPEDDREWEGGADLGLFNGRVSVGLTAYNDYVHNDLYMTNLGITLQGSFVENVGDVRNLGWELEATVIPVETRTVTATVTLQGSIDHSKLLRLAPGLLSTDIGGAEWFVAGYPLYSYFGDTVRYADVNGDGTLEPNELYEERGYTTNPPLYMGSSLPATQMSAAPSLACFRGRLTANAVFQYQGGYKVFDGDGTGYTGQAASVLGAPLWLQAYGLTADEDNGGSWSNSFMDGTYLSWNELSMAVAIPAGWARAARLRNAALVLGVQNLALWTVYPFGDPRVSNGANYGNDDFNQFTNTQTANNDIRSTSGGVVPLTRQWMIRLNLGW